MNERWVTLKDGRKVRIKTTSEYMNDFIRNKGKYKLDKNDIGIHYGNLGKARDTTYFSINSSNRSTGHFGTGTYFYGKEGDKEAQELPFFSRKDRPRHEIDFSEYDLYKPKDDIEARNLHEGLKAINYGDYDKWSVDLMKHDFKINGVSNEKVDKAIEKVKQIKKEYNNKHYENAYDKDIDSLSTIFMKELNYNGIDVRHIREFDNGTYGSVIYDLNKKKRS